MTTPTPSDATGTRDTAAFEITLTRRTPTSSTPITERADTAR